MIVETIDERIDAGVENRSQIKKVLDQARNITSRFFVQSVPASTSCKGKSILLLHIYVFEFLRLPIPSSYHVAITV